MDLQHQHTYQVSELTIEVRQLLESSYPNVWVEGEISNLARPASGHLYFSLKDEKSQVRCAFFKGRMNRLDCKPTDGMKVRVKARVSLYENRGDFQLIISQLEEAGLGNLQLAYEKLKQKLNSEGLFQADQKKKIPPFAQTIGVITSASGAVIKDIISTCERRYPLTKLIVYPVQVQGERAALKISQALAIADKNQHDVLIVGRGGGSLEDLWAFNEEILARAIFSCTTPVISAVGHEVDFTIADFVADVRAPTPTAAAEIATPDREQLLHQLKQSHSRITLLFRNQLFNRFQQTDLLTRRLIHPYEKLNNWKQINSQCSERLKMNIENRLSHNTLHIRNLARLLAVHSPQKRLNQDSEKLSQLHTQARKQITNQLVNCNIKVKSLTEKLIAISPQSTLERGYAIVTNTVDNEIVKSVKKLKPRSNVNIRLADGNFTATRDH